MPISLGLEGAVINGTSIKRDKLPRRWRGARATGFWWTSHQDDFRMVKVVEEDGEERAFNIGTFTGSITLRDGRVICFEAGKKYDPAERAEERELTELALSTFLPNRWRYRGE